ncbi:MAG: hypothetical protein M1820_004958 [Bogoriella megaspora]|nr:MAG: hypothetical protein M1820_004958 [Bogoriella megaspora]
MSNHLVADEHEETGRKWFAGDAKKSARGFIRAIEAYDTGLAKYQANFDLAYNKAVLQLYIAQRSRLLPHLPVSHLDYLQSTVEACKYAQRLEPEDKDALFNTGQALSICAEALEENDDPTEAIKHLINAIEYYTKCLQLQAEELASMPAADVDVEDGDEKEEDRDGDIEMETNQDHEQGDNVAEGRTLRSGSPRFATVIYPTTEDDKLDTAVAELEAIMQLLSLFTEHTMRLIPYQDVIRIGDEISQGMPISHSTTDDRQPYEIALVVANYKAEKGRVFHLTGILDIENYSINLEAAFEVESGLDLGPFSRNSKEMGVGSNARGDPSCLHAYSVALTKLANTARVHEPSPSKNDIRWHALTRAHDILALATTLENSASPPPAERLAALYEERASIELRRSNVVPQKMWMDGQTRLTLVKNAAVYYRGARRWAEQVRNALRLQNAQLTQNTEWLYEHVDLPIMESVAEFLAGQKEKIGVLRLQPMVTTRGDAMVVKMREVVQEMVDEGMVEGPVVQDLVRILS